MNKTLKKILSFCISAAITASLAVMPVSAEAATREMSYSGGKLKFTPEESYMGGATVMVASYNEDKTLKSVKTAPITNITLGEENEVAVDAEAGDKIMLWTDADDKIKPIGIAVTVTEDVIPTVAPTAEPTPTTTPDDVLNTWKFDFGTAEAVEDGYMAVTKDTHYNTNIVDGVQFGLLGINEQDYKLDNAVDGVDQQQGQVIVLADSSDGKAIGAATQEVANYKVAGDYPIRFSMKAENNHYYRVSVELTTLDNAKNAVANLYSERRHAIITEETIKAGETKTVTFTATPQNVAIKNRAAGTTDTYRDDMLNVVAVGDNLAVSKITVDEVTPKTTIWMYDDSTGCDYPMLLPFFPYQNYGGTGQFMSKYLSEDVAIVNQGDGGINAADNIHWNCAKGNIKEGDYIYVQYGHNHKDDGPLGYINSLSKYYEHAVEKGANLILAAPIERHNAGQYDSATNTWSASLGGFAKAAKYYTELIIVGGKAKADEFVTKANAEATDKNIPETVYAWADEVIAAGITADGATNVAYIDLNQPTLDWLEEVCEEIKAIRGVDYYERNATDYYYRVVKNGGVDGTHPNDGGADNTASFFFDEAAKTETEASTNAISAVEAAVLEKLVANQRNATPYKISEEIVRLGGAGGAGWPDVYVPDNLPELPSEIKKIEFNEDGTVAKATVEKRPAKLDMAAYGIVVITVYDADGDEKGKLYAVDQVDNTVDGTQEIKNFRGDVSLGDDDTYTAVVLKAVDSEGGLIVDEENPETYSAVFEPTEIEAYLITDEDGNGTEDFDYYGAIYDNATSSLSEYNSWIVGGSDGKSTYLNVEGDRHYASLIGMAGGSSCYMMKKFNSSIGTTGRYMLEMDMQYISGSGMAVSFAGEIKASSPFASNEINLFKIASNGSITVNGTEAGALNTNSWATVKAILDMDAGTVSVSVAGGTPVVAEISNYAKFTSDITPASLAGLSFNTSKTACGVKISNLTAAKLYDDKARTTVSVSVADGQETMGSVYVGEAGNVSNTVLNGETVTINAVANTGYIFDSWTIDGVEFSRDAENSLRLYKNVDLVAHFVVETNPATVTVNYLDANGNEIKTAKVITTDEKDELLRTGNAYTLADTYKSIVKVNNADDASMYDVYAYDSSASDSFEIATLAETNTINVKFTKLEGLYFDYEDFSNVTDDWGFVEGKSGNVNILADGSLQLYAGSGTSTSGQISDVKTLDAAIAATTKITVGFDWRNTVEQGKGRNSLFTLTDADGNEIITLNGHGKNGTQYYLNGDSATAVSVTSKAANWINVTLTLDFEAKTVSGKITDISSNKEYEIAETAITASNLSIMKTVYGYSTAPQAIDNVFFKVN